jgi:hypothetical protein
MICPQCGNTMIPKDREMQCSYCNYTICEECNDNYREIQDNNDNTLQEDSNGSR